MNEIILDDDQERARDQVMESWVPGQVTTLVGPAGSGKTTLVNELVRLMLPQRQVVLGAPTGMAASVLARKADRRAWTMHKLLYMKVWDGDDGPIFDEPSPPCLPGEAIIIDEASMVGSRLFNEFMEWVPADSPILFVGDKEQLEPVKDTWGPDLDNPTAQLTKVHRQALESPILAYATAVREGWDKRWEAEEFNPEDDRMQVYDGINNAKDWLIHQRLEGEEATLLTFTHKTREWLNAEVRKSLGLDGAPISPGDKLVVKANNRRTGLMNGHVVTVDSVSIDGDIATLLLEEYPTEVYVNLNFIEDRNSTEYRQWCKTFPFTHRYRQRTLHVHYGQCLTVHSSQGSQWSKVGFVWDQAFNRLRGRDREGGRRLLYTAVTRAADNLVMVLC